MNRLVAAVEAVLRKRQQHLVLFVVATENAHTCRVSPSCAPAREMGVAPLFMVHSSHAYRP
jgi:hypothetical protein